MARGVQSIHVKKCWLVVRCNIWEIISSTFWFIVASSVRFCLFNDVDIVKSSRNERNFLFVCFEANGSLRSSRAEENWSIIVTKLSQNCVWMANNEGGRVSIKLPGPGQSRSLRPWSWVDTGVTRWGKIQHEKLSQPLSPPFLNHGKTRDCLGFPFWNKRDKRRGSISNCGHPCLYFCWTNWEFMVQCALCSKQTR